MSYFIKNGNTFRVSSREAMDLHDLLPAGNYVVKVDQMGNFFLETVDAFVAPPKVYGDCTRNTERIIHTFNDRSGSTGVMLAGEKGSGKTLLSKNISMKLAQSGVPTIIINTAFKGDSFNTLIQSIDQPCVILFDEFEKVYDRDDQEHILTLLDGVFPTKKLFILTCNDKWRIDAHMRNRPGRIFYMIEFKGLSAEFIAEYCADHLKNISHTERIINIAGLFGEFNFDMLKALVEEMNRYDEDPVQALTILNAKPEFDSGSKYAVTATVDGVALELMDHYREFEGNPLGNKGIRIGFELPTVGGSSGTPVAVGEPCSLDDPNGEWHDVVLTQNDLVSVDARAGVFTFETLGVRFTVSRQKERQFAYPF